MTYMLQIILDDIKFLPDLIQAWREIGVSGTTIMKSVGGYRTSTWLSKVGLGAIDRIFEAREIQRKTLVAVIEEDDLLAQAIAEAERVVGGFDRPNSGVLLVLPVTQAKGLHKAQPQPPQELSPPALRSDWMALRDTPITEVDAMMELEPTIVSADTSLDDVACAMLTHPRVHVVSVVAEDGRLLGLLTINALADDLFFHILPEEFLSEITDLEKLMAYADKTRLISAKDAMSEPVWVKRDETVKEAFRRMHDNRLPGLPIVDEGYHVIGYINLLELLSLCVQSKNGDENTEVGQ
jgi:CBS domain-containing protein